MNRPRRKTESYAAYKANLKAEERANRIKLAGRMVHISIWKTSADTLQSDTYKRKN